MTPPSEAQARRRQLWARRTGAVLRRARTAAALALATTGALLLLPAVAFAGVADDSPGHAGKLSITDGVLIFGCIPVGAFLLVALITLRPGTSPKNQRYRPGKEWTGEASWVGTMPESTTALPSGSPESGTEEPGGASGSW